MSEAKPEAHPHGERGPWWVNESHVKYEDPWIRVVRDEVTRPDGAAGSYCVAHLKSGVCVVAVSEDRSVHLTREFHYGVNRVTLEAVSGGRDDNEEPLITAKRELQEELGIRAAKWLALGIADPFTANVVSPTHLFLAMELDFGNSDPEGTEEIEMMTLSWSDAITRVYSGEISHAPSGLCLLKADAYFRGLVTFPEAT